MGPSGPTGPAGPPGSGGGGGGGGVFIDPTLTAEEQVAELRKALAANGDKYMDIVIEDHILGFYDGSSEVDSLAAEGDTRVNNLLGYNADTNAFSYYIVDPLVIDVPGGRTQYLTGIKDAAGNNPKINASLLVNSNGGGGNLVIRNIDFVPGIAVCVNYLKKVKGLPGSFNSYLDGSDVTSGAIGFNDATDYVCDRADEYAGVVVMNGMLDMTDVNIDMTGAAGLTRTVGTVSVYAQDKTTVKGDTVAGNAYRAAPLSAVNAQAFAYLEGVGIVNDGQYGLIVPKNYLDIVQVEGGEFAAKAFPLVLYAADVAGSGDSIGTLVMPTATGKKSAGTDVLSNKVYPVVKQDVTADPSNSARMSTIGGFFTALNAGTNENSGWTNIVSTGAMRSTIFLKDLATDGAILSTIADLFDDVVPASITNILGTISITSAEEDLIDELNPAAAFTFANLISAIQTVHPADNVSATGVNVEDLEVLNKYYPAITEAVRRIAKVKAIDTALDQINVTTTVTAKAEAAAEAAAQIGADEWIDNERRKAAASLLKDVLTDVEDTVREEVYQSILEPPVLTGGAVAYVEAKYDYDFVDDTKTYTWEYGYKYTISFDDIEYDNLLWDYIFGAAIPGEEEYLHTKKIEIVVEVKPADNQLTMPIPTDPPIGAPGNIDDTLEKTFKTEEAFAKWLE